VTPKKEWQPFTMLAGVTVVGSFGAVLLVTKVLAPVGIVLLAYLLVLIGTEVAAHTWNSLERFADWYWQPRRDQ